MFVLTKEQSTILTTALFNIANLESINKDVKRQIDIFSELEVEDIHDAHNRIRKMLILSTTDEIDEALEELNTLITKWKREADTKESVMVRKQAKVGNVGLEVKTGSCTSEFEMTLEGITIEANGKKLEIASIKAKGQSEIADLFAQIKLMVNGI